MARTEELGGLITEPDGPVTVFEAAPRLAEPRCGPGWLAVGDRAMKLDPLSGSGAASAVRQAILAAAVVGAPSAGVPVAEALAHYARRLHDAFLDHLAHCLRYYGAAFSTPAWSAELDSMRRVLHAQAQQQVSGPYRLRLRATGEQ